MLTQKAILTVCSTVAVAAALVTGCWLLYPSADTSTAEPNALFVWDKLPSNGSAADVAMEAVYAAKDMQTQGEAVTHVQRMADQHDTRAAFRLARFFHKECAARDYQRAFKLYQEAADAGDGWASNNLGLMYLYGQGVAKNPATANGYFSQASERDSSYGDDNLALSFINGSGVDPNPPKGIAILQSGVDRNQPSSMSTLAYLYTWGATGVGKDQRQAFNLYARGAALGDSDSQLGLAEAYISDASGKTDWNLGLKRLQALSDAGSPMASNFLAYLYCCGYYGFSPDKERGFKLHELAAAQGSEDSAVKVGWMVMSGDGTRRNAKLGLSILKRLSDRGYPAAANKIGELYHDDEDLKPDASMAVKYWTRGSELGSCKAMTHLADAYSHAWSVARDEARSTQYTIDAVQCQSPPRAFDAWRLGTRYRDGIGIAKDCKKAFYWSTIAAQSRDQDASIGMTDLGFLYEKGCDTPPDLTTAFHWYLRAAKLGEAVAQNNVGAMLKHGKGVERTDLVKAYAWLTVAKLNGSKQAAQNLTEFARLFNDSDRLQGLAYVPVVESKIVSDGGDASRVNLDDSY